MASQEFEEERSLMAELTTMLHVHRSPSVVVGSGRTTTSDKFSAVLHAFWLESGSGDALKSMCAEVIASTTDLGVEFSIVRANAVPLSQALPWAQEEPKEVSEMDAYMPIDEGWGDEEEGAQDDSPPAISFPNALPVAGLLHIISTISSKLTE